MSGGRERMWIVREMAKRNYRHSRECIDQWNDLGSNCPKMSFSKYPEDSCLHRVLLFLEFPSCPVLLKVVPPLGTGG